MKTTKALKHLKSSDSIMAELINTITLKEFRFKKNNFHALVDSIISQQLSTKAARTIAERFRNLVGGRTYSPADVLSVSEARLRTAGLSQSKVKYIRGIAEAANTGMLNFKKLRQMPDEEIIAELTKLHGIGRWTAEMFLIFSLNREDVFSLGDLGIKNAMINLYKLKKPSPKKLLSIAKAWEPHRSLASLYLWSSLDQKPIENKYSVYILKCRDGTLYCGITNDVPRRLEMHNKGLGSKYVRAHGGGQIVYEEKQKTKSLALKREFAIKSLSRAEKLKLIKAYADFESK